MKLVYNFLFLFSIFNCFSQHNNSDIPSIDDTFVKYSNYKEMIKSDKFKVDSIGSFISRNKDTLIKIKGNTIANNGVRVVYEEKDSIFLKKYRALVFNSEYGKPDDIKKARMRYWKDEIKVYIDATVPKKVTRKMKKMFKFLDKEIDSLKITNVNRRDKANYFIYFINKPSDIDWDKRIKGDSDGAFLSWNGKQQIFNSTIKINTQMIFSENEQLMNLKKHFIWSLGYFYLQPNQECESFLSNCVYLDKTLSKSDLELLKYHYSYGICKGIDLETFDKQHENGKKIKKENPKNKQYFIHYN